MTDRFTAEPFGQDCLGNATGWRVYDNARDRRVMVQYVANLYEDVSSLDEAKANAEADAARLNAIS